MESIADLLGETENLFVGSTPSISQFNPKLIPFQMRVVNDIRGPKFDFKKGVYELLFSGSVGSAKSLLAAHLLITHCLKFPKARALMGRQVLGDLKDTLIAKVLEHMEGDLVEGKDYEYNRSAHKFVFDNGSELISRSWHDKNFKKFRSLELSAAAVEEAVENGEEYKKFYWELLQRIGRLQHVPENWIILLTNPDSPAHWIYRYFMKRPHERRKVYYSKTSENIFLPKTYIEGLRENLDPKEAMRMLDGLWIEISDEVVYHNYKSERNFIDEPYEIDPRYPIDLSHDFNIGDGKPMSANLSQYINGVWHFFKTFAVDGARTGDIMEEIASSDIFENYSKFRIFGDRSGKSNDTRSIKSDYQIIQEFIKNYQRLDSDDKTVLQVEMCVPLANPPLRERHNLTNAAFQNVDGLKRVFLYPGAEDLDEGFRLTKLKKGGDYIEDDSFRQQHCTTAAGYMIHYQLKKIRELRKPYQR